MNRRMVACIVLCFMSVFFAGSLKAQTETTKYNLGQVVVSATKTEEYVSGIGASATVISSEEIRKSAKPTVFEILKDVPGVSLTKRGGFGGGANIYLRGTKPGHTLVMIDGVKVNDPIGVERSCDFAHISANNIERIEVIRGSQSTLYGPEAIGGVINIITKKGSKGAQTDYSIEGGSHNTFSESLAVSGANEKLNYSLSVFRKDSDGISMAKDTQEDDSYAGTTVSSNFGARIFDNSELSFVMRYTGADYDIDDGAYEDDPNYTSEWEQYSSKLAFKQDINENWDHCLAFSFMDIERSNLDFPDAIDAGDDLEDKYTGDNRKIEWQHNFSFWENLMHTFGAEHEKERGTSDYRSGAFTDRLDRRSISNYGYYFQNQLKATDNFSVLLGVRADDHEIFGKQETYKASSVYSLNNGQTRIKGNCSAGFKAPAIYQLYSSYGTSNLSPDKSRSYDFGFEQEFFENKLNFSTRYFYNNFKNMVEFDMTDWKYKNIGRAKTDGYELETDFSVFDGLKLAANYTFLRAKNKDNGKTLAQRPRNSANFSADWGFLPKWNVFMNANYSGARWNDATNANKLKHFLTADLALAYEIKEDLGLSFRIVNIFDDKYQIIRGYNTEDRSCYAGIKGNF
ncbi:MAG: TonB-dependent receptor [Candidatus Omnitrophica bacterium]|nr:TonB-dependent receptor [Candidatus Omnitrophota bacterium]